MISLDFNLAGPFRMNWLATGLGVSLAAALLVQGFICLTVNARLTKVGALSLLLAGISLFSCFAFQSGSVVLSTDFGILLVQGTWNTFLLGATIVAVSLCAGLCWLSTRERLKQPLSRRAARAIWCLSVLAGASCFRFSVVQSSAEFPGLVPVRFYGMWFPPLVIWLLVCFSQSVLALLGRRDRLNQFLLTALLIIPVALYGLGWQEIGDPLTSDPFSRSSWLVIFGLAFSGAIGLSAWKVLRPSRIRLAAALFCFILAASALGYMYWNNCAANWNCSFDDYREPVLAIYILLAAAHAWAAIRCAVRRERDARVKYVPSHEEIDSLAHVYWEVRGRAEGGAVEDWQRAEKALRERGPAGRREPYLLASFICILAVCLFDLLYFSAFRAGIDLVIAFIAWFLLAEFVSKGAVSRIPEWTFDFARGATKSVVPLLRRAKAKTVSPSSAGPASAGDNPAVGAWKKTVRIALPTVAAVAFLVAISEAIHYGSTVIEPFADPETDSTKERPGDQLAKLLVDELSQMRKDIPELAATSRQGAGASGNQSGVSRGRGRANLAVASEGSNFGTAVAGSNELDVFGLKIPLGTLAVLVQAPVRYVFRIEQITGNLYKETMNKESGTKGETGWRAVAISSQGKTWTTQLVPLGGKQGSADFNGCDISGGTERSPIHTLAHELAFRITTDQPDSGMTQSPVAFANFDRGIYHLNEFDRGGKSSDLRAAITCFQNATFLDQGFADGYDRLAVALERNREPLRAIEALRSVSYDKANYIKALLRRADAAYNLQTFYDQAPAILPPAASPAVSSEAVGLWYQVAEQEPGATPLERRAAYAGICQSLSDEEGGDLTDQYDYAAAARQHSAASVSADAWAGQLSGIAAEALRAMPRTNFYLPYYFCQHAEALYAAVPESGRGDPDVRAVEATVLNLLGNNIDMHNQRRLQQKKQVENESLFSRWLRRPFSQFLDSSSRRWDTAPELRDGPGDSNISGVFCDANAIDVSFLAKDRVAFQTWDNPVARYSLPYYAASHRLAPDDTSIACNYASAALYSTGDPRPLLALRHDLKLQVAIGDALSRTGREFAYGSRYDPLFGDTSTVEKEAAASVRSSDLARFYYQMALQFYDAAGGTSGSSLSALNAYGDCVGRWAMDARRRGFPGPAPDQIATAINSVGMGIQYLSSEDAPSDLASLKLTFAELRIAQGRPEDALGEISDLKTALAGLYIDQSEREKALNEPAGLRDTLQRATSLNDMDFLYLFIDSAHANACASLANSPKKAQFEQEANKALKAMREMEEKSELRHYSDVDINFETLKGICFARSGKAGH